MKKMIKRAAMAALTGIMVMGSLAGCAQKVDGTKTVTTINDEVIKLGTVNFMLRYQQAQTAQMYQMYFGQSTDGMWSQVADEKTGETYGEQTVAGVVEQIENMVILRQHAKDYDVTISKEEEKEITAAAQAFVEANDEATLKKLGADQAMIEEMLELSTYNEKMFDPIVADVDRKVSEEEAAQTGVTFVKVEEAAPEEASEETKEGEEAEADKEPKADAKTRAQQILDELLATADADMDAIAKGVDEDLSATTTHFTTNPKEGEEDTDTVPKEIQDGVKELKDGEVAGNLIEVDGTYYVVRLDAVLDADATEDQKKTIINDREQAAYDEITKKWREDSTINQEKNAVKSLKVMDNDKYSFKPIETPEPEADAGDTELKDADAEAGTVDEAVDAVEELSQDESTENGAEASEEGAETQQ